MNPGPTLGWDRTHGPSTDGGVRTLPGREPYVPPFAVPPGFTLWHVPDAGAFARLLESEEIVNARRSELHLAWRNATLPTFDLAGECLVCGRASSFVTGWSYSGDRFNGLTLPNWREWLVCRSCGLSNRHRACAFMARAAFSRAAGHESAGVYAMECVTPFFAWLRSTFGASSTHGSEYLGPSVRPGSIVHGIRHEDVENLSFDSASFRLVVSNDVLEHVFDPRRACAEIARVLVPGGHLLLTVPIDLGAARSVARARRNGDRVEHLATPAYHGDPLNEQGCLVVTDFGWDILDDLLDGGFARAGVFAYVAPSFGHLGAPQVIIHAEKD